MATQGVVSIVGGGQVRLKAVAGCNGMQAGDLAEAVGGILPASPQALFDLAVACGFGCPDCLVVQSPGGSIGPEDFEESAFWSEHFPDPRFNPRWECGMADYVQVVEIQGVRT